MNLQSDDFELFDIPRQFVQRPESLETRWKQLMREVHPDRFAAQGGAAQRLAMQWTVRINEAYRRLRNPLLRAAYLCELQGVPVQAEDNTAMPAAFLMQQMEWREQLEEAVDASKIEALQAEVARERAAALDRCEVALDRSHDTEAAARQVRALMFIERFSQDLDDRRAVLAS
jgi:molecular chaperone HscB